MKFLGLVLLPALLQVLLAAALISLRKPGGEFVGLGVMLLGLVAIPATALLNWSRTRANPPQGALELLAKTFFTTAVFPLLGLVLYALAS
jgi:hypothetical protein